MTSVARRQLWPRGPWNELHDAAVEGSTERLVALLSDGSFDINQGNPKGNTPLMLASGRGHTHAVRILLDKEANVSTAVDCNGYTALHHSAQGGHLAISKMLLGAGADLKATDSGIHTPLHLAAAEGHFRVVSVLIEAGTNPDSRCWDGATPLYIAAQEGHMDAVKVLLRAKANPMLTRVDHRKSGRTFVPLGIAAQHGHLEVVRELVQQVGIGGCGGASGGVQALTLAAQFQHQDIMAVLTDAGVVDTGRALTAAAAYGPESSVKFLLQQRKDDEATYVNFRDAIGQTPLLFGIDLEVGLSSPSPRIVRMLVDAGVDTRSAIGVTNGEGMVISTETPLALTERLLRDKKIAGKDATEEQLRRLEGTRRLLLRVEAVHAASFLWPVDIPAIAATAVEGATSTVAASTPLRMILPMLRRRARRPRVLLGALFRWVVW